MGSALSRLMAVVLLMPRVLLMSVAELFAFLISILATVGWTAGTPLSPWRQKLVDLIVPLCCRIVLLTVGFWRIDRVGHPPATNLIVSNHVSMIDGFVLYWLLGPRVIFLARKEQLQSLPLYGRILTALGTLFVDRSDLASRRDAAAAIHMHCSQPGGRKLLIFPEGTVDAGREVLPFKPGAFMPLEPVGIVALRYPSFSFSKPQTLLDEGKLILNLVMSVANYVEVSFLGVLEPPLETADSDQAARVRAFSAAAQRMLEDRLRSSMNVPQQISLINM